ncbi:hypothetical protein [Aeoliella mucimassa]|uniref:PEP-CTERM protein-sorting domain-containing protein n=1 Tax=Aeoliella mucimassa TaxID=2527972 RepID=A0A518AW13_9BACT|nr:hypothetical protein [Aeoliella mucimassa]QDU58898.1 hypothetical protein Pan181_51390 [Aeoliella mucimassa]
MQTRHLCWLLITLASIVATRSATAQPFRLPLTLTQSPTDTGVSYAFEFFGDPWVSFTAPTGEKIGPLFGSSPPSFSIEVASFAELQSNYFGTWKIDRPESPIPGAEVEQWEFELAPFALDDVFHEVPTITSPQDLAVVGESYVVSWQYPPGVPVPSDKFISVGGAFNSTVTFETLPGNQYGVNVELDPGFESTSYNVRVGTYEEMSHLVTSVTNLNEPRGRLPDVEFAFRSLSTPLRLTTVEVPEPTSAWLLLMVVPIAWLKHRAMSSG